MLHRWIKWIAIVVVVYSVFLTYQSHKQDIKTALPDKAFSKTDPNDNRNAMQRGLDTIMRPIVEERLAQELKDADVNIDSATVKNLLDDQLTKKVSIQAERKTGTGPALACGYTATVQYISYVSGNVEVLNTRRDKEPVTFRIGSGQAIPGIEQGIVGMQKGGIREVVIPAELAQNPRLPAHKNGPAAVTRSVIEVTDISPNTVFDTKALAIKDISIGRGDAVQCGQTVGIRYSAKLTDGTEIKEMATLSPLYFSVGSGYVPFGLEQAVIGMRRGGERNVVIPAHELGRLSSQDPVRLPGESALPKEGSVMFDITLISLTDQ